MRDTLIGILIAYCGLIFYVFVLNGVPPLAKAYVKKHPDQAIQWILEK